MLSCEITVVVKFMSREVYVARCLDAFRKDGGVFGNPLSFRASEWCSSMGGGPKDWWVGGIVATTIATYGVQQLVYLHVSTGKISFVSCD